MGNWGHSNIVVCWCSRCGDPLAAEHRSIRCVHGNMYRDRSIHASEASEIAYAKM